MKPGKGKSQEDAACALCPGVRLIGAIDVAKEAHTVQFYGMNASPMLGKPLTVWNNRRGIDYLCERSERLCRKLHIDMEDILFCSEDPGGWAWNWLEALKRRHAGQVKLVNAARAAAVRRTQCASTDGVDTDGIARTALTGFVYDLPGTDGLFVELQSASRARRGNRKGLTACESRIHAVMDRVFPGLLKKLDGVTPFGEPSMRLLERSWCHAARVAGMRAEVLARRLSRCGFRNGAELARAMVGVAADAVPCPPARLEFLQARLSRLVHFHRDLQDQVGDEETVMARCLVQTPGFWLTTFPGVGVVLAGTLMGELGAPELWRPTLELCSYGGLAPGGKQSGGPEGRQIVFGPRKKVNHVLKDALMQISSHVGKDRHPARRDGWDGSHLLQMHRLAAEVNGRHTRLSTARLFLRVARRMVTDEEPYLPGVPRTWVGAAAKGSMEAWWDAISTMIEEKWRHHDLSGIPPEGNRLEHWRKRYAQMKNSQTAGMNKN